MNLFRKPGPGVRAAAAGAAAVSLLLVGGCGNDTAGPETGADVQDVQEAPGVAEPAEPGVADPGAFDTEFSDVDAYVGKSVTVSADVNDVVSPTAFTIAGTENAVADELLILHKEGAPNVTEDSAVAVTGTVREGFSIADAERYVGTDLDDNLFTDWVGEHYIEATSIDLTVSEPGEATTAPGQ